MSESERSTFSSTESAIRDAASDRSWANGKDVEGHVQSIGLNQSIKQKELDPHLLLEAMERARDSWDPPERGGNLVKVVDYRDVGWKPDRALEVVFTVRQLTFERELEKAKQRAESAPVEPEPQPSPAAPSPAPEAATPRPIDPMLQENIRKYSQFTVEANFAPTTFIGKGKGKALELPLLGASKDDIDNYVLGISIDERYGNLNLENVSRWNNIRVAMKLKGEEDEELPRGARRTNDDWVTFRLGNDRHMGLSGQQRKFLNSHLLQSDRLEITIDQSNLLPRYNGKTKLPQKSFRIVSEPKDWKTSGRRIESMTFRQEGFGESDVPSVGVAAPEPNDTLVQQPSVEAEPLERAVREDKTYRDLLAQNADMLSRNVEITAGLKEMADHLTVLGTDETMEPEESGNEIAEVALGQVVHVNCEQKPRIVIGGNIANSSYYEYSPNGHDTEWLYVREAKYLEPAALSLSVEGSSVIPHPLSDRRVVFHHRDPRLNDGRWESVAVINSTDGEYEAQQKSIGQITSELNPENFWFDVAPTNRSSGVTGYEIRFKKFDEDETNITGLYLVISEGAATKAKRAT